MAVRWGPWSDGTSKQDNRKTNSQWNLGRQVRPASTTIQGERTAIGTPVFDLSPLQAGSLILAQPWARFCKLSPFCAAVRAFGVHSVLPVSCKSPPEIGCQHRKAPDQEHDDELPWGGPM